jgi:spore coat polysaccharide biosynthesis protein SpsF
MRIGAIIFSRYNSSRLPGKALMDVSGKPLLMRVLDGVEGLVLDDVVVATSKEKSDDVIVSFCEKNGVNYYRGPLENVAKRALDCAKYFKFDYFVRVNGDSPIIAKSLINKEICELRKESGFDLVSNVIFRDYPYGFSLEIIKTESLQNIMSHLSDENKEHLTQYFYQNNECFNIKTIRSTSSKLAGKEVILTVDDIVGYNAMELLFKKFPQIQSNNIQEIITNYNTIKQ